MAIKLFSSLAACMLVAGCTLGPNFKSPVVQTQKEWFRTPVANTPQTSMLDVASPTPAWWERLNDPELNSLVGRAAHANLDVRAAASRLEQSRAERGVAASELFPQVTGDASYMREKESDKGVISLFSGSGAAGGGGAASSSMGIPSSMGTPPFNVYQYGFDASWELDLWGRVRRGVEAADAGLQASVEAKRAAEVSVIAELARDYLTLRGTQATSIITRETLRAAEDVAALTVERERVGLGNGLDVANAKAEVATIQSQMPPLDQQQTQEMNAIALLLAEPPGALEAELNPPRAIPPVPLHVPVGVPSELVKRRPDIRQADAELHMATAEIGVAKADFFPRITLTGNFDLQALQFKDLGSWDAKTYGVGPSLSLPIFEGGRLVSTLHLRKAQEREAAIDYRKTVLNAFHEVDNALTAFRDEQARSIALKQSVAQNRRALALATKLYKEGLTSFLDVLTAEKNLLSAEMEATDSSRTASTNMVQLYKALGGGWEEKSVNSPGQ